MLYSWLDDFWFGKFVGDWVGDFVVLSIVCVVDGVCVVLFFCFCCFVVVVYG